MPGTLINTPDQYVVTRKGAAEYTGVHQNHSYTDVSGLRVVARCGPGSTPKVVRVHEDYGTREVAFSTSRSGRPPIVPQPVDIAVDGVTTDIYLGGQFDAPLPSINQNQGGYNWSVSGVYTYLQVTNRKPGTHTIPTGGYPHVITPNDPLAAVILEESGVGPSGGDLNAADGMMQRLGAVIIDHTNLFPWPYTSLPPQMVTNGLIGG